MHFDWLMNPVTLYATSALCLLTSVALVVSMKLQLARTQTLAPEPEMVATPDHGEVRGLRVEMEQLRESVSRLEESLPVRGSAAGLNLTKRAVALRMHRRGEPVSSIAAALETPLNEVALLVKVHTLTETKA
jgi:hypothetical protein